MSSKLTNEKNARGGLKYASQVFQICQIFREYNRYSIKNSFQIMAQINHLDIDSINKALRVYQEKTITSKKAPNPNYFIATATKISQQKTGNGLGKVI